MSHLLQMRGLKLFRPAPSLCPNLVASFTDAWIETQVASDWLPSPGSHLLQMRGLKLVTEKQQQLHSKSHLLQMRGLKL